MDPARHVRQVLLPEIGEPGQRRIEGSVARVGGSARARHALAHEVAEAYARGAGFAAVEPGTIDLDELAPSSLAQSGPAREVLAGARAALGEMRAALGIALPSGAAARPGQGAER